MSSSADAVALAASGARLKIATVVIAYFLVSIALVFVNKVLLTGAQRDVNAPRFHAASTEL